MFCPCSDNSKSNSLYKINHENESKIDVRCTSYNSANLKHWKPNLFKCTKCSLIFSEYIGVDFEDSYNHVVDEAYINQIEFKTKTFKLFFSKIRQYLKHDNDILEIGSYYGILGNIIKPHVKSYMGLELSKHATRYSKKKFNLNIINQSLKEFSKNEFRFDVIIMTDVIEHLDKPFETLNLIQKNLKPNGILVLSTFNIDSIVPRVMRSKYYWIIPMHKYYFSNSTLKYFLNKYNLDLFKIKTDARLVSLEYLFNTLIVLMPKLTFVFKFFLKFDFFKKLTIRINLLDLNIYFAKKT
jgi:2-polyprenyl-3-methyl-5-hydroxy-6-metoxy-1,4-benzoquinol methylase